MGRGSPGPLPGMTPKGPKMGHFRGIHGSDPPDPKIWRWVDRPEIGQILWIWSDPEILRSWDPWILGLGSHEVPQILWIGVAVCHSPRERASPRGGADSQDPQGQGVPARHTY